MSTSFDHGIAIVANCRGEILITDDRGDVIGSSVDGRGSTAAPFASPSFMKQGRQLGRSEAAARQPGRSLGCWLMRSPSLSGSSTANIASRTAISRPARCGEPIRREHKIFQRTGRGTLQRQLHLIKCGTG